MYSKFMHRVFQNSLFVCLMNCLLIYSLKVCLINKFATLIFNILSESFYLAKNILNDSYRTYR